MTLAMGSTREPLFKTSSKCAPSSLLPSWRWPPRCVSTQGGVRRASNLWEAGHLVFSAHSRARPAGRSWCRAPGA